MEWEKATKKEERNFEIPETWLFLHYYEVLTILFRVENALRVFVYSVLKNTLKEKWIDLSITSDESQPGTIGAIAKRRISQAEDFGYLGYFVTCPIMYLTTGELIRLIFHENYWKYFSSYFPGKKEIMENKLLEISNVRNSIAHFRPIEPGDVELIKQNAVHVLDQIESFISQLTNCRNVVPTNTLHKWYKDLKTLGSENITISLFFSDNEEWLRIELKYNCPIIKKDVFRQSFVYYRLLTIISPVVLDLFKPVKDNIIYLSEQVPYQRMEEGYDAKFSKNINMVISKTVIEKNHEIIYSEIKKIIAKISEETDLIKQDSLATGEIVKAVSVRARYIKTKDTGYWYFYDENMSCSVEKRNPPEFWGNIYFPVSNFISETHKYPWMPTSISEIKGL